LKNDRKKVIEITKAGGDAIKEIEFYKRQSKSCITPYYFTFIQI